MPELPEVETVARQLAPRVSGRRIKSVEVHDNKLAKYDLALATGYRILDVRRVGKRVIFDLARGTSSKPALWLGVHLRMTGRLLWYPDDVSVPSKSRLIFHLTGGELRFADLRRFGIVELHNQPPAISSGALDPLSRAFSTKAFATMLADARGEVKPFLMRQDKLPGMGNIYASEALFAAHIHPRRSADSLTPAESAALRTAIGAVLRAAIRACGTTFSTFADSYGKSGKFQDFLKVYGRRGKPCRSCGAPIAQITQQQRSTFFCPQCQH